jgi:hypothetical protein
MQPLLERLHELGYSEGKNMTFEYRSAEGRPERLPSLALELVRANPDVLIAGSGTLAAQADYPNRLCDCRRPIGRRYRRQPRSPWGEYHSLRARKTPAQCVPRTALSSSHPPVTALFDAHVGAANPRSRASGQYMPMRA